jgi:hypothetical protein
MLHQRTVFGWITLWLFLFVLSLNNHPSLALDEAATSILIAASLIAFYSDRWSHSRSLATFPWRSLSICLLVIVAAGCVCALLISKIYDVAVGADPHRFAMTANAAMDSAVVAFNVFAMKWVLGDKHHRHSSVANQGPDN